MQLDVDYHYDKIVENWEKRVTDSGIPYYVNHASCSTSWDHPYFSKVLEELGEFSDVKYAAYRTAVKLQHLQRRLNLHRVTLGMLQTVMEDHGYGEGCSDMIGCVDLLSMLGELFRAAEHHSNHSEKAAILSEVVLNFLLNLFDLERTGCVRVSSVKIILTSLCAAKLAEKYRYFYQELRDPSTFISERSLARFIHDLIQVPDLIRESLAFGKNVSAVVASCFQMASSTAGVSEDMLYSWLLQEPQTLVWLPTLHRITGAQFVTHEVKCGICKASPIIGLRYRCLKCFNLDLCQQCFFTGCTNRTHKTKHPMQEYCLTTTTKDATKAFLKTLRNNLSKKHRHRTKVKYLPIDASGQNTLTDWSPRLQRREPQLSSASSSLALPDMITSSTLPCPPPPKPPLSTLVLNNQLPPSPDRNKENQAPQWEQTLQQRQELESIIRQLQDENRMLYKQIAEMKQLSDTESNFSFEAELQRENDLYKAERDVLEDHNIRLTRHLTKVQNVLKESPLQNTTEAKPEPSANVFTPLQVSVDPPLPGKTRPSPHSSTPSPDPLLRRPPPALQTFAPIPPSSSLGKRPPSLQTFPREPSVSPEPFSCHSIVTQTFAARPTASLESFNQAPTPSFSTFRGNVRGKHSTPSASRCCLERGGDTCYTSTPPPPSPPPEVFYTFPRKSGARKPLSWSPSHGARYANVNITPLASRAGRQARAGEDDFAGGLPSLTRSQFDTEEEEEIRAMLQRVEDVFPAEMSYSAYTLPERNSFCGSRSSHAQLLKAANEIGDAMTCFVQATAEQQQQQTRGKDNRHY